MAENKQTVSLGRAQSGAYGLFTGHYMAWPLTPQEYSMLNAQPALAEAYCKGRGFQFKSEESNRG
jgi:hypothetical protein